MILSLYKLQGATVIKYNVFTALKLLLSLHIDQERMRQKEKLENERL